MQWSRFTPNSYPPKDHTKHYTPPALAQHLVSLAPFTRSDYLLDPAAGHNKVFYQAFPGKRSFAEIEDGIDFLTESFSYDWAITNPPYHLLWLFIDKASEEARKGFAFLVNINGINTLTPRRLQILRDRGFYMRRLHVCNVKRWMGRFYWYVFVKEPGPCEHSWDEEAW